MTPTASNVSLGIASSDQAPEVTIRYTIPPSVCTVTSVVAGPPKRMKVAVSAPGGLARIVAVNLTNVSVQVPAFSAGTTAPVNVVATKLDQSKRARFSLDVTDGLGRFTFCN